MVGILQFFDFGQASCSRKLLVHGRRSDGFQPPRNSLDVPIDAYKSFPAVHEAIPNSQHYSDKEDYQHEFQLNYLIDEERLIIKKEQYKKPSVVARLMGMETPPSDLKPTVHAKVSNFELRATKPNCISSSQQNSAIMKTMKHLHAELLPYDIKQDFDHQTIIFDMDKPRPREHPQEELLQKFKKEFEAWQASKVWERSESLQLGNSFPSKRYVDILPQENLSKEKLSRNDDPKKNSLMKKNLEPRYHVPSARPYVSEQQEDFSNYEALVSNPGQNGMKDDDFRDNTKHNSHAPVSDGGMNLSDSPRRIVILKPCYEMTSKVEESLSSPMMLEKQKNMHEFLQQVKERLITEIQGKPQLKTTTRWNDSELFASEKSTDCEQISQRLVKQIGEAVCKDNNIILLRSKSTRSYRNEIQPSGQCSPEFINRDTRKSLSERMKNVMKSETDVRSPFISKARSFLSHSNKEVEKFSSMQYFDKKNSRKTSYLEDKKVLNESRSFRHIHSHAYDDGESPRNLMRSYSAPVSGTEFGKLLLEDKNALTAVHIHRKHEMSENNLMSGRKMKKEGFNIKSRVSSLKQNLSLKGKLFGKRIHLLHELAEHELLPPMKASETTPSVVLNLRFAQDNSTEVPPSPASVCSSPYDEICRPYYPSPVSPLEALFTEDHIPLPPLEELNSNLLELNTLEEPKCDRSEEATSYAKPAEDSLSEFEYNAKSYVREILVASGLLERNYFDEALWEWDSPRKPISMLVFDEVEEIYQNNVKLDFTTFLPSNCHVSHRILFDLLNEVLLRTVQSTKPSSTFKKWFIAPRRLPHGDELLVTLWRQIQLYIKPSVEDPCPVESIVGRDLRTPWSGMLHEDIDTICLEVESLISENLIDELVCNLSFIGV